MQGDLLSKSQIKEITVEAYVVRCNCGDPTAHAGLVCPDGIPQAYGVVAHWRETWLTRIKRFLFRS